jgi:hypothetical protein
VDVHVTKHEVQLESKVVHRKNSLPEPNIVGFKFNCYMFTPDDESIAFYGKGVLRVPLLQDPELGIFFLSSGEVDIEGTLCDITVGSKRCEHFTGGIKFSDKGNAAFLVLDLTWCEGSKRLVCANDNSWKDDDSELSSEDENYCTNIHEWARNAGGYIRFPGVGGGMD